MSRITKVLFFLAGSVILGNWAPAYGQTGDCFDGKPGCLDPTFGVNGRVINQQGMTFNDVAIQQVLGETRIVVVGVISNVWALARYRLDGTLDPTFGNNGIVIHNLPNGRSGASAVVVQPDNKLVVIGTSWYRYKKYSNNTPTFVRYFENGSVDASFGTNGVAYVPYGNMGWGRRLALQSNGKIAGVAEYFQIGMRAIRLNANGTVDTTFNGNGISVNPNPGGGATGGLFGIGITVQTIGSEERIVLAGDMVLSKSYQNPTLFRFTSTGTLDAGFGGTGAVEVEFPPRDPLHDSGRGGGYVDVKVDSSNRLVAMAGGHSPHFMTRHDQFGNLDTTFGENGFVRKPRSEWPPFMVTCTQEMEIQPDGTTLVAGSYHPGQAGIAANWRFTESGGLDTYFGFGGWVTTDIPGADQPMDFIAPLALQPDGKAVMAGYGRFSDGTSKHYLIRYQGIGQPTHDIGLYEVVPDPFVSTQGDTVAVRVGVANNGTFAETADVTVTDSLGGTLGMQSVSLAPGEFSTLTFNWVTDSNTAPGERTLQATVTMTAPGVTDEQSRNDSDSATAVVAEAGVSIVLNAYGYFVNRVRAADLSWTGAYASTVDIYRNGGLIARTSNTGAHTDTIGGKGAGTFVYKVCEVGSTRCSNTATVVF